jgi:RecA-family ATPase
VSGGLPIERAHKLALLAPEQSWLIEQLWSDQAVGIVGGEPKCCKSFLALDMAVAVASATPCLRQFAVPRAGRVLLFAAEDALHVVRRRLEGICAMAGLRLADLDIHVITAPSLRLDLEADRRRLTQTVSELQPHLLILDPFVRLHRVDENVSAEVAPLLAYLRELQRAYGAAVVVVHHARKGAARVRAGQALRGSSEFHAWGDSNLYLRRTEEQLSLCIEHRAAAAPPPVTIALHQQADALALQVIAGPPTHTEAATESLSVTDSVEHALSTATAPMPLATLRQICRVRTQSLCQALSVLRRDGKIVRRAGGYQLAAR